MTEKHVARAALQLRRYWLRIVRRFPTVGMVIGCPMGYGLRIIVDDPSEYIQKYIALGKYEPYTAEILMSMVRTEDVFVDVGANIGFYSLLMARKGASVYAFEPVPQIREKLKRNVTLNRLQTRVNVLPLAISDRVGEATLYVAERRDNGSHSLIPGVEAKAIAECPVTLSTLDELVRARNIPQPTIVKIDVEGAEAQVLDGMYDTLQAANPPVVVIETADRLASSMGECARSVLLRLLSRGYALYQVMDSGPYVVPVQIEFISGEVTNYVAIPRNSSRLDVVSQFSGFGAQ